MTFKTNAINSVFGENGRGKSSLFEALSYALVGSVPKLAGLPADEKPEEYYCNRFHSGRTGTIHLTFTPEFGGTDIEIRVKRDSTGKRFVDSPSGYSNPSDLLKELGTELTLLDYSTFRRFVEDTPLQRGRAFSGLLGLEAISSLRQTLEVVSNKGNLKSDFPIERHRLKLKQIAGDIAAQRQLLETAYCKLLGKKLQPNAPLHDAANQVSAALAEIQLIAGLVAGNEFSAVDFEQVRQAIRNADSSDLRSKLEVVLKRISTWEGLKPTDLEKVEVDRLRSRIQSRNTALESTKGALFLKVYTAVDEVFKSGLFDAMICPACDAHHDAPQDEATKARLQKYSEVSAQREAVKLEWSGSKIRERLLALESNGDLALPKKEQVFFIYENSFSSGDASESELDGVISRLQFLDGLRLAKSSADTSEKTTIEAQLPPSLVLLTEQIEAAQSIQTCLGKIDKLEKEAVTFSRNIKLQEKWIKFISYVETTFSGAEIALSTAKTKSFETSYRKFYEGITANPSIVPVLQKAKGSEELHLRLEKFFELSGLSAATLLPESYRNALAISIYLTSVLQSGKPGRFVVLDDVTSSFDAGHQFNLMNLLQNDVAYPQNPQGVQIILLSHDGLLEKFFDKMSEEVNWNHYRLDGLPPCGNVLTTRQDTNRVKLDAERFLKAGQVAQAKPLIRQFLEYSLLRIIRKLAIPVPLDFAIRDENKMAQSCIDAINAGIEIHQRLGDLVLTPSQVSNWKIFVCPSWWGTS